MINFQQASAGGVSELSPSALRRLWFWAPIAAGGTLAVALMLALGLPQILEIRRLLNHLQELEQQRQELSLLELQSVKTREDMQRVRRQGAQLVRLVAGSGSLATVLATLDLEASQAKVQLQLYEPLAAGGRANAVPGQRAVPPPPAAPPPPAGTPGLPPGLNRPAPVDPMSKAGLRERSLVLEARGTYPRLLDFLRRLEALDVLVEQKDLSLSVEELQAGAPASRLPSSTPVVDLRLSLTLWSKDGTREPVKPLAGTNAPSPVPPAPPG
jgi:type IV pilus assembly protein PilO